MLENYLRTFTKNSIKFLLKNARLKTLNQMKLILFISWLAFVSCTALDERFMLDDEPADLVVETDNGPLEAYKASDDHLQWAALGRIRLVKKDNTFN
jgi:hypothetical protein